MSVSSVVIVIHVFEMLRNARMAGSVTLCRSTEGASERQVWAVQDYADIGVATAMRSRSLQVRTEMRIYYGADVATPQLEWQSNFEF